MLAYGLHCPFENIEPVMTANPEVGGHNVACAFACAIRFSHCITALALSVAVPPTQTLNVVPVVLPPGHPVVGLQSSSLMKYFCSEGM
jgi:hypothetical protein